MWGTLTTWQRSTRSSRISSSHSFRINWRCSSIRITRRNLHRSSWKMVRSYTSCRRRDKVWRLSLGFWRCMSLERFSVRFLFRKCSRTWFERWTKLGSTVRSLICFGRCTCTWLSVCYCNSIALISRRIPRCSTIPCGVYARLFALDVRLCSRSSCIERRTWKAIRFSIRNSLRWLEVFVCSMRIRNQKRKTKKRRRTIAMKKWRRIILISKTVNKNRFNFQLLLLRNNQRVELFPRRSQRLLELVETVRKIRLIERVLMMSTAHHWVRLAVQMRTHQLLARNRMRRKKSNSQHRADTVQRLNSLSFIMVYFIFANCFSPRQLCTCMRIHTHKSRWSVQWMRLWLGIFSTANL